MVLQILLLCFLGMVIGMIIVGALLTLYGVWMVIVDEIKDRRESNDGKDRVD